MNRLFAVLVLSYFSAQGQTFREKFGSEDDPFFIDFVTIGNLGNEADSSGNPNPVGRVDYAYNLGKYEISRDQIHKANAASGLGITLADITAFGGNGLDRPATGVSWNELARFVNWLNTSRGHQAAYRMTANGDIDTVNNQWSVEDSAQGGLNRYRHKDAQFFIPTRDEWYKAAYGSPEGEWFSFATGSDTPPSPITSGTDPNSAVYGQDVYTGPADVQQAGGVSAWGTMGQNGNVWEWTESTAYSYSGGIVLPSGPQRELRGGAWFYDDSHLVSTYLVNNTPNWEGDSDGFRIAMVPEPSSLSLLLAGGAVLMAAKRRQLV